MFKKLFLILSFSALGVIIAPSILTATDTVSLTDINSITTPTILAPEITKPAAPEIILTEIASTQTYPAAPENYIQITGRTIEIFDVSSTSIDAGDHVNRYGSRFLYGHNSNAVFGALSSLSPGDTFSTATDGSLSSYQIAQIVTYKKINAASPECQKANICRSDVDYLYADKTIYKMSSIVNAHGAYDLAIMTCAGESLGGGDATHRLVIYANQI